MRRIDHCILTHSGLYFDLIAPRADDVSVLDIARALSHICRYTGHTHRHYSVAEHSVRLSHLVSPSRALAGLLHDAAEAYVGDVSLPLKRLLPNYADIERNVQIAVFGAFGLPAYIPEQVKAADRYMLAWERRDLMNEQATPWPVCEGISIADAPWLAPWDAETAMERFLARYFELRGIGLDDLDTEEMPCAA